MQRFGRAASAGVRSTRTSVFFITKSENANQVHYGVHLDSQCNIAGAQPVYAYWRMREGGGTPQVEGLLRREQSSNGISSQAVTGNAIRITLRAACPFHKLKVVGNRARFECLANSAHVDCAAEHFEEIAHGRDSASGCATGFPRSEMTRSRRAS